jgi:hypothetical protein
VHLVQRITCAAFKCFLGEPWRLYRRNSGSASKKADAARRDAWAALNHRA